MTFEIIIVNSKGVDECETGGNEWDTDENNYDVSMGWKQVFFFFLHLLTNSNASDFAYFTVSFVDEKQQNYNIRIDT